MKVSKEFEIPKLINRKHNKKIFKLKIKHENPPKIGKEKKKENKFERKES